MADGTRKRELVFTAQVVLGDEQKQIDIILTESEDALLGTGLLADSVLTIDFVDRTLEVARK
ncbi:MAG TPA: hypothetical protein EYP49_11990 [Anaerolineae bacterium]|nr:hypothetical protein [Anaerolineae bacterium]